MASGNPLIPSTRVFLTALNPAAPQLYPGSMHGTIIDYEHLPRYTSRSDRIVRIDGRLQALSPTDPINYGEGPVSRVLSMNYMEDLSKSFQQPEMKKLLNERRTLWRGLYSLVRTNSREDIIHGLRKILQESPGDPYAEGVIRDVVDLIDTGRIPTARRYDPISAQEIGIKSVARQQVINKQFLKEKAPAYVLKEWINGVRADQVVEDWKISGVFNIDPRIQKLTEFVHGLVSQGIYIGDLNSKNIIWSQGKWIVVDSGGVSKGLESVDALERYIEKITVSWTKSATCIGQKLRDALLFAPSKPTNAPSHLN